MGGLFWALEDLCETKQRPLPSSSLRSSERQAGLTSERNELVASSVLAVTGRRTVKQDKGNKGEAGGERPVVLGGGHCWYSPFTLDLQRTRTP